MGINVFYEDTICSHQVASATNIILNTILLVLLVLIPIPQYIRIIGQKSEFLFLNPAKGLVPHAHFILSAAYQALFLACVLYISSLSEGPIECCRSRGLYGPDEQGNGDRHLKGWNAFGVLLGVVQVAVLFLGTLLRMILVIIYAPPHSFSLDRPQPASSPRIQALKMYARLATALICLVPILILMDAIKTALNPSERGFFPSDEEHKLVMAFVITVFYFVSGWVQFVPVILVLWRKRRANSVEHPAIANETRKRTLGKIEHALQIVVLASLGASLGIRDVVFAKMHIDEIHSYRALWTLLFLCIGSCEAWSLALGRIVMYVLTWGQVVRARQALRITTEPGSENAYEEEAGGGNMNSVNNDDRTALLSAVENERVYGAAG